MSVRATTQARHIAALHAAIGALAGPDGNAYATTAVLAAYTNGHYSQRTIRRAITEALAVGAISVGDRWQRQLIEGNRWEWRQIGSVFRADNHVHLLEPGPLAGQVGHLPSRPNWPGGSKDLAPSTGLPTSGRTRAGPQPAKLATLGSSNNHKRTGDIIMSPREYKPDPKPAKVVTGQPVVKPGGKVGLKRAPMAGDVPVDVVAPAQPDWRAAQAPPPVSDGSRPANGQRFLTAAEKREERLGRSREAARAALAARRARLEQHG